MSFRETPKSVIEPLVIDKIEALLKYATERGLDQDGSIIKPLYLAVQRFEAESSHDLKHTFGRRLRAARVSFETRQVLPGHRNGSITTHYSAAEIGELIGGATVSMHPGRRRC